MQTETEETRPEYIEAVVQKKPRFDDEREQAIKEKIEKQVLREKWAQGAFAKIRKLQIDYMREAIDHANDERLVYDGTQKVLKEISQLLQSKIVDGAEFLEDIPKKSSALVMTNHLGAYKLTGLNPEQEFGVQIPNYDFMYPSPMYFAGFSPLAEAIESDLSYVSNDFPGVFGRIHREAGFIHVPPKNIEGKQPTGRTEALLKQTEDVFKTHPNTALVNFPEGGTSGKYSGLGPYDLDSFKTGGYIIASKLQKRIIPVAQYFNPQKGLELKVFKSYIPQLTDRNASEGQAELDRRQIQEWLNERKDS